MLPSSIMPIRGKVKVEGIVFCVENDIELSRAETVLTKEEGTIRWLNKLQKGDVLYDVGANVGCYSLYAAAKRGAKVYAFEPHVGTAHILMQNVIANGLSELITVLTCALSISCRFLDFNYSSKMAGSSGHGLRFVDFKPAAKELKSVVSLDYLCEENIIPPPTAVKIDIDGGEVLVINGMQKIFYKNPPRTIQVEMAVKEREAVFNVLKSYRYSLVEKHHTSLGKKQLEKGASEDKVVYNAVFEKVA